jgi:iron(III) transport system ATP-binding protein
MPEIRLENVAKNYGAGPNAVSDLNLTVNDGDFMCLLGPSGCGKTTTVRMIAGLENATGGSISIGDRTVDHPDKRTFVIPEKRDVGMVFQSYALWPHLSVQDNVEYGLKLQKKAKKDRQAVVDSVMTKLGISQYRDRYPAQLSGGQQQRVALARMLAVNPSLMLLDEPLSNLDSRLRLEMRSELKRIHEEFGSTVVFVTHDQWEAMTLATRIAVLNDGVLQQVGTPMEIYDRPVNRFVANFLGVPPINFIEMTETTQQARIVQDFLSSRVENVDSIGSVGIRPESFIVASPDEGANNQLALPATIESIMPTGGSWTIQSRVGDQAIYSTILHRGELSTGDAIGLTVPAEGLHVFDTDEQRMTIKGA